MSHNTDLPGTDAEREALLAPLCRAIESGCLDDFRHALAGGAEPGSVHWEVARAIPWGVIVKAEPEGDPAVPWAFVDDGHLSIAQLCFHYDRPEMLTFAANALWPEVPDDTIRMPADRMDTLCTRHAYGELARINLAHYGAFWKKPQSVKFITLALAYGQDSENLRLQCEFDPESAALLREARMQLAIDRRAATEAIATPPARALARHV